MPPQQTPYQSQYQTPYRPQPARQLPIKKILIFGLPVLVALFALNWFRNQSYIEVNVTGGEGSVSYQLVNQASGSKLEVQDAQTSFRQPIQKGNYELLIRQGDKNYFTVVNAGGFYGTAKVDATVESEKAREFIGNAPAACTNLIKNILISHDCGESMITLKTHVPATANLPTYAKANNNPPDDLVEGIIRTKEGDILISYEALVAGHEEFGDESADAHSPHNAFKLLNADIELRDGTPLLGLDSNERYSFQAYKGGFVAYRLPLTSIFYYPSLGANQEIVDIGETPEGYSGYFIGAQGDDLIAAFTPSKPEGARERTQEESFALQSDIALKRGDDLKRFVLPNTYNDLQLCGQDRLCALGGDRIDIYDVSGAKPKQLFRVNNAKSMLYVGERLVINRGNDVLSLDVTSRTGHIQYGSNGYSVCGLQTAGNTYIVCVTNNDDRRSALRIDQSKPSDDIDEKVAELRGLTEVQEVSVYGKYIFVSPKPGERKYIPSLPGWGYDPAEIKRANDKINQEINRLGIDRNTYKITSTQR